MTLDQLQELLLLEDFKRSIPENVVVHLNEQKVANLFDAAVFADEFVLTHRTVFSPARRVNVPPSTYEVSDREATRVFSRIGKGETQSSARRRNASNDKRVCFYCLDSSHLISDCKAWKQKNSASKSKSVALVHPYVRKAI